MNKRIVILLFGIIIALSIVTNTLAYFTSISTIENNMDLGSVSASILEQFNNTTKRNVKIKNNGSVPEYVRVYVNIYFKMGNIILNETPILNTDYTITYSSSSNWLYNSSDGYYYYKNILNPNDETDILIDECTKLIDSENKILNVDILTQSIQAVPSSAVTEAWGVSVVNNSISLGE